MGIYRLKPWKDRRLQRLALWLIRRGVTPNSITLFGLAAGVSAALCLWKGLLSIGLLLVFASLFADLLDGTVARTGASGSLFGKFLDAVSDRIVETAWVGALIATARIPWWGWLLPLGSVMLLTARVAAFKKRMDTSFVRVARFERMAAMLSVLVLPWHFLTYPFYLAVALITTGTAVQIWLILYRGRSGHFLKMDDKPVFAGLKR